MNQAETFEWLRQRSNRLDEVEAENKKLQEQVVHLSLKLAQFETKELRDECTASEDIEDILDMRLYAAARGLL